MALIFQERDMIRISIQYNDHIIRQVSVIGHAGGRSGRDVVCAAVSAVTQTALAGLLHYDAKQVQWDMKKGVLTIEIKSERHEFSVILNTMYLGLRHIEEEHPDRVRINISKSKCTG